jgi:hypothetical protein
MLRFLNTCYIIFNFFRFLRGAEEIGLKKLYKNGTIREFLVEDMNNFENSGKL